MLALLAERNFDLVMVDLRLGGGDGLEALGRGGNSEGLAHLVVVMLSGREDAAAIDRAFRLGAAACMSRRAVTADDLPGRVDAWMEQGPNFRSV